MLSRGLSVSRVTGVRVTVVHTLARQEEEEEENKCCERAWDDGHMDGRHLI